MPRVITEEFVGVGVGVKWEEAPDVDPADGQPRKGMDGLPKMKRLSVIIVHEPLPDGNLRITRIPLDDQGRQALVRELTGGITVPEIASVVH